MGMMGFSLRDPMWKTEFPFTLMTSDLKAKIDIIYYWMTSLKFNEN
jgi:hypothetical protein